MITSEGRLVRPDGRIVAWAESGPPDGRPIMRLPGTPGSRFSIPADQTAWLERGLRMIVVERPGFGASTPLPGHGFGEPADDLAAVCDYLGIDRLPVCGGSGGGPYVLAFASRHPDRVAACSIASGGAPMTDEETAGQIEFDAQGEGLVRAGRTEEFRAFTSAARDSILADPIATFTAMMADAPPEDRARIADPEWMASFARGLVEALSPGVEGWIDEVRAFHGDWAGVEPEAITCSLTWWHSRADRNCPFSAAERLVRRIPNAELRILEDAGHLGDQRREGEFLDELLARAAAANVAAGPEGGQTRGGGHGPS